jgi:hypothetical protein
VGRCRGIVAHADVWCSVRSWEPLCFAGLVLSTGDNRSTIPANTRLLTASFVAAVADQVVVSVHLFEELLRRTSPPTASIQDPQSNPLGS